MLESQITEVLITAEQIKTRVEELGKQISADYRGQEIVVVCVLKGGFIFTADLIRNIEGVEVYPDFISVSSYGGATRTSGIVKLIKDLDTDVQGRHVLIVEDIVDSGLTLSYLSEMFAARHPKSLKICTLFDKPSGRKVDIKVEYAGFEVPGRFIVGYGLDYNQHYRNLPYIACLD